MFTNQSRHFRTSSTLVLLGAILFFFATSSSALAQQNTKIWSDSSGEFSVEAALIEIKDSSVLLEKLSGIVIEVPIERLSAADRKYVDSLQPKPAKTVVPAHSVAWSNSSDGRSPSIRDGERSRATPIGKPMVDVSLQEIEQLPEPHRTTARLILESSGRDANLEGLQTLSSNWPEPNVPTLNKLIRGSTKSPEADVRKLAVDLLAQHDAQESLDLILSGMDDKNFFVRWACYQWIAKLGDPRAISVLVAKLETDDRDQAAMTLISIGSTVEPHVFPLLNHESVNVQLTVISMLAKIGSLKAVPVLETAVSDSPSVRVRMQAKNAINRIGQRQ